MKSVFGDWFHFGKTQVPRSSVCFSSSGCTDAEIHLLFINDAAIH